MRTVPVDFGSVCSVVMEMQQVWPAKAGSVFQAPWL